MELGPLAGAGAGGLLLLEEVETEGEDATGKSERWW